MYNKNQILCCIYSLSAKSIYLISAKSAPHILSFKDQYTLYFLNFLIFGLCNSSANCWFRPVPVWTLANLFARIADFLLKTYKPLKQDLFCIYHILIFKQCQMVFKQYQILYHIILYKKLFF